MCSNLELSTVGNNDSLTGLSGLRSNTFASGDYVGSFDNFSKHTVLAIKPWAWDGSDEKLGAVGVGAAVSPVKKY